MRRKGVRDLMEGNQHRPHPKIEGSPQLQEAENIRVRVFRMGLTPTSSSLYLLTVLLLFNGEWLPWWECVGLRKSVAASFLPVTVSVDFTVWLVGRNNVRRRNLQNESPWFVLIKWTIGLNLWFCLQWRFIQWHTIRSPQHCCRLLCPRCLLP